MEDTFLTRIKDSNVQDYILDVQGYANELTVEIRSEQVVEVMRILKNQFGFTYLADITASDHYSDEKRFELSYNLVNLEEKRRLRVSCRLEEDDPRIDSVIEIWQGANWYEREAWDMMGIRFNNHPDLRRIYMPEDFQFHPLRKEFPQLGIPGSIQMPEKDPPKEYK
jgi:NADH-quinone oxidoreductase subunit C